MKRYTLTNESDFPTSYLRMLVDFVFHYVPKEARGPRTVSIVVKRHPRTWCGRAAGYNRILVRMNRRAAPVGGFPYLHRDHRISYGHPIFMNTRTVVLVFVIAHEVSHLIDGWAAKDGGFSLREFRANDFGEMVVKNYSKASSDLWATMLDRVRRERMDKAGRMLQAAYKKSLVRSPEYKRGLVQKKLDQWQRRLKLAQTKVRQYRQKAMYYERKVGVFNE